MHNFKEEWGMLRKKTNYFIVEMENRKILITVLITEGSRDEAKKQLLMEESVL